MILNIKNTPPVYVMPFHPTCKQKLDFVNSKYSKKEQEDILTYFNKCIPHYTCKAKELVYRTKLLYEILTCTIQLENKADPINTTSLKKSLQNTIPYLVKSHKDAILVANSNNSKIENIYDQIEHFINHCQSLLIIADELLEDIESIASPNISNPSIHEQLEQNFPRSLNIIKVIVNLDRLYLKYVPSPGYNNRINFTLAAISPIRSGNKTIVSIIKEKIRLENQLMPS